ncbi:MAG: hypothetical protein GC164_12895 [Phycisphaera sp.]|nr:hypothetical protein [Phycisphaera sp.]
MKSRVRLVWLGLCVTGLVVFGMLWPLSYQTGPELTLEVGSASWTVSSIRGSLRLSGAWSLKLPEGWRMRYVDRSREKTGYDLVEEFDRATLDVAELLGDRVYTAGGFVATYGHTQLFVKVPHWAVVVALLVMMLPPALARGRRLRQMACCECGYDLRGSVAAGCGQCPECGSQAV